MKKKSSLKKMAYSAGKFFKIRDLNGDFHNQFGVIPKDKLNSDDLVVFESNTGNKFSVFNPLFIDKISDIKRGPQIPFQKDFGIIVGKTGIGKDSVVFEAGSGSGFFSSLFANIVKEVYSFDVRKDHLELAQNNAKNLGLTNIKFYNYSVYEDFKSKIGDDLNQKLGLVDLFFLDLPEPWKAISNVIEFIKPGGFIVGYVPCITQVSEFVESFKNYNLVFIEALEMIQRNWLVNNKIVRPVNEGLRHSGFLVFGRKL